LRRGVADAQLARGRVRLACHDTVDEIVRQPTGKPDYRWAKSVATGEPVG